jgi:hypothetical protein
LGLRAAKVVARARAAELRGELGEAANLFAQAGRLDEAARVMVLRGDGETDPAQRLLHYVQAAATAPEGSTALALARRKRAGLLISTSEGRPVTAMLRQDLLEVARELEAMGEFVTAAEAYGRAGDAEAEARNLARSGEIDRLDALLHTEQGKSRELLARRDLQGRFSELVATGRRREAAALARSSPDEALREQGRALSARRASGPVAHMWVRGQVMRLVLGDRITVGRVAMLSIASAAVSREHLIVERRGSEAVVRDLGSRNGTTLRGLALAGEMNVGPGLDLMLGQQIPLSVRPSSAIDGAFDLELAGKRYVALLGPARIGVGQWRLERDPGEEAWLELVTDDAPVAFLAGLSLSPRVSLLVGDALATEREGPAVVRVEGSGA